VSEIDTPPIAVVSVFVRRDKSLKLVGGSLYGPPSACITCPTKECATMPVSDSFGSCPWGYEYLRPRRDITAFGMVFAQAGATEGDAVARTRRRERAHAIRLSREHVGRSVLALQRWLETVQADITRAVDDERSRRIAKMTIKELADPLKEEYQKLAALSHDYVKVAAGIRANLERLKRDIPAVSTRPETVAIEGAARRLEDLPSLHVLLADPGAVHLWPDRARHRLLATADSYYYYLKPVADARGVVLKRPTCRQGTSTAEVFASRRALGGVVLQLLDNAIHYARAGENVSVAVDEPVGSGEVSLVIESPGPRIRPEERTTIFLPFIRGTEAKREKDGGGIGLATAKAVVDELGGNISVDQTPVAGGRFITRFVVTLPKAL
jgi:signal transduction histidine kinase